MVPLLAGWQIRQVSCFVNKISCKKNKKKRDAGYSALAPDVLWLEILQTLRFYREGKPVA